MLPVSFWVFVLQVAERTLNSSVLCLLPSENAWGIETPEACFQWTLKYMKKLPCCTWVHFRESSFFISGADLKVFRGNVSVLISILFGQWGTGCTNILSSLVVFLYFTVWGLVSQSCLTHWDLMDYSPSGSSVRGILQEECCSGLPFPFPEDLPNPGIKPESPTLQADSLPSEPPGNYSTLSHTLSHSKAGISTLTSRWRNKDLEELKWH